MTTEVICTLIAVSGTVFSALLSFAISRSTANKEIEKMRLEWDREDLVSSEDEFAAMAGAVAKCMNCYTTSNQGRAMELVASVRAKESGSIGAALDDLYNALATSRTTETDEQLTRVINQKREAKSKRNAHKGNKPRS